MNVMYEDHLERLVQQFSRCNAVPGSAEIRWDEVRWDVDAVVLDNVQVDNDSTDIFVSWLEDGKKQHVSYTNVRDLIDDLGAAAPTLDKLGERE